MTLAAGAILGQYEIRSPLGAGGMGEVYRAYDTRLNREVAIKVLPESVTCDPERLRRFDQEGRAAAALSHPNILAVYQMATHEGVSYMVTERRTCSAMKGVGWTLEKRSARDRGRVQMVETKFRDSSTGKTYPLDLRIFVALVTGSSINGITPMERSLALWLSNGLTLTFENTEETQQAIVSIPMRDPREVYGRVVLDENQYSGAPLASKVGADLWHVRQIYAIFCLLEEEDNNKLAGVKDFPHRDLETLLSPEDRLHITGVGPGSVIMDLLTKAYEKAKRAPQLALNAISLIFGDGRVLVLRQVKATTESKELDVELKKLDLYAKKEDIEAKKIDRIIEFTNKINEIKDEDVKKIMRDRLVGSLRETLGPDAELLLKALPA